MSKFDAVPELHEGLELLGQASHEIRMAEADMTAGRELQIDWTIADQVILTAVEAIRNGRRHRRTNRPGELDRRREDRGGSGRHGGRHQAATQERPRIVAGDPPKPRRVVRCPGSYERAAGAEDTK